MAEGKAGGAAGLFAKQVQKKFSRAQEKVGGRPPTPPPTRRSRQPDSVRGAYRVPGGPGPNRWVPGFSCKQEWDRVRVSLKIERFERTEEITRSRRTPRRQLRNPKQGSGRPRTGGRKEPTLAVFVIAIQRRWYFTDDEIEGSKGRISANS